MAKTVRKTGVARRTKRTLVPSGVKAKWSPFEAICSECYEKFVVEPKPGLESIVCPECDHGAKAPSEEFMRKWTHLKNIENKKLLIAIAAFAGIFLLSLVWMLLMVNPEYKESTGMHYAFLGIDIILAAVTVYFAAGYEGNRYEAYF